MTCGQNGARARLCLSPTMGPLSKVATPTVAASCSNRVLALISCPSPTHAHSPNESSPEILRSVALNVSVCLGTNGGASPWKRSPGTQIHESSRPALRKSGETTAAIVASSFFPTKLLKSISKPDTRCCSAERSAACIGGLGTTAGRTGLIPSSAPRPACTRTRNTSTTRERRLRIPRRRFLFWRSLCGWSSKKLKIQFFGV